MQLKLLVTLCLSSIAIVSHAETLDYQFLCPSAKQVKNSIQTNQNSLDVNLLDADYNKKGSAKLTYNVSPNYSVATLPDLRFGYVYVVSNNNYAPIISCVYVQAGSELLNKTVVEGNIGNLPGKVSTIYLNETPSGYGYSGRSCQGNSCKLAVYTS